MTDLLHHCESHLDELLAFIEALVRLESPSTDKAAVDRCGRALADRLRALGGAVDLHSHGERAAIMSGRASAATVGRCCCSVTSIPCGRSGRWSGCRYAGTDHVSTVRARST